MNSLINLHVTYKEYSLAPTDDLISFWRSNAVKVAKASTSTLGRQSPSSII